MPYLVLLGDSIFDNGFYVPGELPVIEQLRQALPEGWSATLVAVDGNVVSDVPRQLQRLPADATHLAISAGGNDALRYSTILGQPARSIAEVLVTMSRIQAEFQQEYREMLAAVQRKQLPTVVCTIYDAIPDLPREALAALSFFNDVILREAARAGVSVLDLRVLCREGADYSSLSPIEPSAVGGAKIAGALARFVAMHDFSRCECVIFT